LLESFQANYEQELLVI